MNSKQATVRFTFLLVLLILFVGFSALHAIENKFEYITPEDGLSQGNIEFIFQDSKGFMWFGTFNGLNRFDGYDIRSYFHDPQDPYSLPHEHVVDMVEDANENYWIGTYGTGISVYIPSREIFINIDSVQAGDEAIRLRQLSKVTLGPEGNIWVADETAGIFVFNPARELVKYYRHDPDDPGSIPESYYFGVVFDKSENGWFGVGNGMLCKKPAGSDKFEVYHFEQRVSGGDDGIKSIFIDSRENIWIGTTSQGAYKFDPVRETFTNYRKNDPFYPIGSNTVMGFAEDEEGNIYIGCDGGGITIVEKATGKLSMIQYSLANTSSLSTNAVYCLTFDRTGNFWVGTYSGGVNFQSKYKNKFKTYTPDPTNPNSLSYKNVTSVIQDREGEIWIGTDGGGLNWFNMQTDSFRHYRANPNDSTWLQTDVIIHLMQDSDGDIYLASYNHGLTIFNKYEMTWTQYLPDESDPTSIAGIHPWFTYEDSYGTIWVGMLAVGLDKFDKTTGTFTHYMSDVDDPTKLYSPNIKIIYEDRSGTMWVGTEGGGLGRYNREEDNFTRFVYDPTDTSGISNNDVRELYEDTKNRFWVGTGAGLCLMDRETGTFQVINKDDGLPGNTINGILEDETGHLWISTDAGISKFNPDNMEFQNYDKTDGMQGNEFNYTASTKTRDGYFIFGGKNGFDVFKPSEIKDNPFPPPVVLTKITVLNQDYSTLPKTKRSKERIAVKDLEEITFTHRQNILTFEFSALDYSNPVKNQFRYKMEGFDDEWTYTSSERRFATYMNLPGGDYTFRVQATNGDGVWSPEGLALEITVTPPFWKRTWFILLVIAIVAYFIIRYVQRREVKLKEEKELLQQKIEEGLETVNKQKAEFEKKDRELQERIEAEREQKWYNEGMVRISQVMSQKKDDLKILSRGIITELVEYLEVQQGAIYILNDEDEGDVHLVLQAAYAPDNNRLEGKRIELEEGQIGACFREREIVKAGNLPDNYALLTSGLGEHALRHMVLIPLKLNEIIIGVVELLAFTEIDDFKIDFVSKSGETLTSILTALKATDQTQRMLEKQKMQSEEMAAQEEELRQNLEEMQATQEELERMKLIDQEKQVALEREEYLFNALLENANEHIYFKDKESKFIRFSRSMLQMFKLKSENELLGKSDFDFFSDEHARPAFEGEQEIIKTGEPIVNLVEKETHKDGSISWVSTTKKALYDKQGKIVGTWGISKDITATKKMESEIEESREKLITDEALLEGIVKGLNGQVCLMNHEGNIILTNEEFAKSVRKKSDSLPGKSIFSLLEDKLKATLTTKLKETKKNGNVSWKEKAGKKEVIRQLIHIEVNDLHTDYYLFLEVS